MSRVDEAIEATRKLLSLLEARETGLLSWWKLVAEAEERLHLLSSNPESCSELMYAPRT